MRLRFPKSSRLVRAFEFQRMRREATTFHGKLVILNVLPGVGEGAARIGIITSRRLGGAVVRVGLRRRMREVLRVEQGSLLPGSWMVVVPRKKATEATFAELRGELLYLVGKARKRFLPA